MKKSLIALFLILAIACSALVFAPETQGTGTQSSQENVPEGYTKISDRNFTTIFNNEDIKAIFGIDPVAVGGKLLLRYGRTGAERNLGYVYGTIVADVKYKKLAMTNGGFISYEQQNVNTGEGASAGQQEESASGIGGTVPEEIEKREVKITGEKLLLNSANPVRLAILIGKGVYSQHDYSAVCNDKCQLVALIEPDASYLNITGEAFIVKTEILEGYLEEDKVHIKNTNRIRINDMQDLSITVMGGRGTIEDVEFSSDVPTVGFYRKQVLETYYDSIVTSYEGNTKITLPEGKTLGIKNFAGGTFDIDVKGHSPGYASLQIKDKTDSFILGTKELYNKCARKVMSGEEERVVLMNSACIFIDSLAGEIDVKPRRFLNPLYLTIKLPALNVFNMLSMEQFEELDTESYVELGKAGSSTTMVFRREDINAYTRGSLSPGILPEANFPSGAWYELGVSFSAYVYDITVNYFNHFECNVHTKECFLDGDKVMGFEQQKHTVCTRDSECGAGQACKCVGRDNACQAKRCVTKSSCNKIQGLGTRGGSIDVLFVADEYDNEAEFISDIKRVVDNGLFTVEPFSLAAYKNKFEFYSIFGQTLPSFNYGGVLAPDYGFGASIQKQCPAVDVSVVLSKKVFRPFSVPGIDTYISMPILSDLGGELVVVHEFGHGFGNLNDEYAQAGGSAHTGQNCIETKDQAVSKWGALAGIGTVEAEQLVNGDYKGCGGDCSPGCDSFYRPTQNSIMNDHKKEGGNTFNDVSKALLIKRLNRFA